MSGPGQRPRPPRITPFPQKPTGRELMEYFGFPLPSEDPAPDEEQD
jgi:hypothetical protein